MKTKLFSWKGVDAQGFCITGRTQAENSAALKNILRRNNISILTAKVHFNSYFCSSITTQDITFFAREIASLLNANIPLLQALQIIAQGAKKIYMQVIVESIQNKVAQGSTFAEALKIHPKYFDLIFCSLVESGEQTGTLDSIFLHLAMYRENMQRLYKNILKALFYPAMVFLVSIVVSMILLVAVIPQFVTIFKNVGAELPIFTRYVISVSAHFESYGLLYLAAAIFISMSVKVAVKNSLACKKWLHMSFLCIPWIGNFLKNVIFARSFRTLYMMLQAGLPVLEALETTQNVAGNMVFQPIFSQIITQVRAGQSLYVAFSQHKIFSDRVNQLLHVGEEAGCLEKMLFNLAEYFDAQVEYQIQHFSQFLEPIIMVILSLIVGALVIAMYLPIFHLGSVV